MGVPASPAFTQEVYGPTDIANESGGAFDDDAPVPLVEPKRCEEDIREDGAIVVCRELPETERYLSPLPRPVQSDRRHVPGLTDPPCWVLGLGPPSCIRVGSVPPYPPLVDTTAFPEPLSEEEAAAVSAIEADAPAAELTGKRVPIDISGDD
ncbi:hypothetical protein [Aurantiacibacter rhizosphaerae]|uniref:Uncharacterized protein n=1 Tax=Aurantiacibacter rhizosphaerae TaxID=2691582 RepID=A0A844XDU6_9SPHN|nr:hypothetical protein [Aurantiacibacter rhizosphaerae]MWV28731.1 hypothetical protein [Aurantiacibacter rhizosphaerae]